jgi:mannose-6-phosphate isomerase-like protein (cupin superfamily)
MKFLLLLIPVTIFAADPAEFVLWKAADLKGYEKTLHARLDADHAANQRLSDYDGHDEGHAAFVVHREGTGPAEAHQTIAHLVYVISGEASLVVGGTMVGEKTLAPEHISGASVTGGQTTRIAAGDVLHIPAKAPHWFKMAPGTQITYLMVNQQSK